jgi:hypothetical protein
MPILPTDEVQVEKITRTGLVALFTGIVGLPHVLDHATYVEGEAEYVRQFGYKHPDTNKTEYRLLEIVFGDFKDLDQGCDDNPTYQLLYTINLLVQHAPMRANAETPTSSTDDFARFIMTLRRKVLSGRKVAGYDQLYANNLKPQASRFGADDELSLRAAHFASFLLAVEVTPSPLT